MIRAFDFIFSLFGILILFPAFVILFILGFFDTGSSLFLQERIGKNQRRFIMVKFRTMRKDTPSVATHLTSINNITRYGTFLRRSKLDELPQLWNVLIGQMSIVGPRPCLPNQLELIEERSKRNIFNVKPGITGKAQIYNIDMSSPQLLAETEEVMLMDNNYKQYFRYLFLTILGKGSGDAIKS